MPSREFTGATDIVFCHRLIVIWQQGAIAQAPLTADNGDRLARSFRQFRMLKAFLQRMRLLS